MVHEETEYVGYDGKRMFMHLWRPSDNKPRALVVAVHGIGSHGGDMKRVGEFLAERGVAVFAPDMRGFGHFEGMKGHVMDFDEYNEDMCNIVMQIKDQYKNRLTFAYGHSLGGLHVIRYVVRYPNEIDGMMLSAPAVSETLDIGKATRLLGRVLSVLNVKWYMDNEVKFDCLTRNKEAIERHKQDDLRFDKVTPRFGIEALQARAEGFESAERIRVPVLMQQGGDDKLVSPEKNREFFDNIDIEDKTWRFYEGFYHELFEEPENERVLSDLYSWLDKRLVR
ncbi:MAG: alpha/beta fold hydrolase [Candidatus Lokiarchaeota archaeon]|nr:alpha/beta fold hydrolase [Candidatus Lokiarchaeota archaeon]